MTTNPKSPEAIAEELAIKHGLTISYCPCGEATCSESRQVDDNAKAAIMEALGTANSQAWIPVEDQLPEEGAKVLTFGSGSYPYIHVTRFSPRVSACEWNFGFPANITHWMPLPQPPESKP